MANSPPVQYLIARIELFTSHILLTQYLGQDFPLSSPVFQITNRVKTNEFFSCTSLKGLMTFHRCIIFIHLVQQFAVHFIFAQNVWRLNPRTTVQWQKVLT